jgi:hypothetical protein
VKTPDEELVLRSVLSAVGWMVVALLVAGLLLWTDLQHDPAKTYPPYVGVNTPTTYTYPPAR